MYIYGNTSLSSSKNEKCFIQKKNPQKIKTRFKCSSFSFPRKLYRLYDNVEKYGTARQATDGNI